MAEGRKDAGEEPRLVWTAKGLLGVLLSEVSFLKFPLLLVYFLHTVEKLAVVFLFVEQQTTEFRIFFNVKLR